MEMSPALAAAFDVVIWAVNITVSLIIWHSLGNRRRLSKVLFFVGSGIASIAPTVDIVPKMSMPTDVLVLLMISGFPFLPGGLLMLLIGLCTERALHIIQRLQRNSKEQ